VTSKEQRKKGKADKDLIKGKAAKITIYPQMIKH
jgi:ribosomal protein S19